MGDLGGSIGEEGTHAPGKLGSCVRRLSNPESKPEKPASGWLVQPQARSNKAGAKYLKIIYATDTFTIATVTPIPSIPKVPLSLASG